MKICQDCGCAMRDSLCVNCDEEAVIFDTEMTGDNPMQFSGEFVVKVTEQKQRRGIA